MSEISFCIFVVIIKSVHNLQYELKRLASLSQNRFYSFFFSAVHSSLLTYYILIGAFFNF